MIENLSLFDRQGELTGSCFVILVGVGHGDHAGLLAQCGLGTGPFAPGERGHGRSRPEGLAEHGGAGLHVGAGVGVDEDGGVPDGGGFGGAAQLTYPLDVSALKS